MLNIIGGDCLGTIFFVGILLIFFTIIKAAISFAPWVPSFSRDLPRIFKLADLQPGQVFYDLGAGDGRVAEYVSKNHDIKAIGLEISLLMYLICKIRQYISRRKNLIFKYKNLYKENLEGADVIYLFGIPKTVNHKKFKEKLLKEIKPGSRIISYAFAIKDWKPVIIDKPTDKDLPIFLYELK